MCGFFLQKLPTFLWLFAIFRMTSLFVSLFLSCEPIKHTQMIVPLSRCFLQKRKRGYFMIPYHVISYYYSRFFFSCSFFLLGFLPMSLSPLHGGYLPIFGWPRFVFIFLPLFLFLPSFCSVYEGYDSTPPKNLVSFEYSNEDCVTEEQN